jgi:hypothetical protein
LFKGRLERDAFWAALLISWLPEGFAGLGVSLCWSVSSLRLGFLPGRRRRA